MPNRILKDSICTSPNIDALSQEAEVFFYRLLVQCDDRGRISADLPAVRMQCYPLQLDRVTDGDIAEWLGEVVAAGLVTFRLIDGCNYIQLRKSDLYQNISKRPPLDVWKQLRSTVFERDNYTCQYCGAHGGSLHCDHVMPVSRGGSNELSNLATACATCNQAKHDKTPEEWLQ